MSDTRHPITTSNVAGLDAVTIDACASLIERNVIMDTHQGKALKPREDGNREGLHYAAAIRALALAPLKPNEKPCVDDELVILRRLADGDTIVFSLDGDMAWFTKGDRAFVGDSIMSLREKGHLLRKRDGVDDEDDPRGIAFYDTISDAGRAALATTEGQS